jgi:hypothetical protein
VNHSTEDHTCISVKDEKIQKSCVAALVMVGFAETCRVEMLAAMTPPARFARKRSFAPERSPVFLPFEGAERHVICGKPIPGARCLELQGLPSIPSRGISPPRRLTSRRRQTLQVHRQSWRSLKHRV